MRCADSTIHRIPYHCSITTIFLDMQVDQFFLTLCKVEFSDKNTRTYLTVENLNNTGGNDLNFRDSESIAVQGKTQFGTATGSSNVNYKNIKTTIPSNIVENGVVLFEPLNYTYPTAEFRFKAGIGYGNDQTFKFPIQIH